VSLSAFDDQTEYLQVLIFRDLILIAKYTVIMLHYMYFQTVHFVEHSENFVHQALKSTQRYLFFISYKCQISPHLRWTC